MDVFLSDIVSHNHYTDCGDIVADISNWHSSRFDSVNVF
jgi:hypothetical protein